MELLKCSLIIIAIGVGSIDCDGLCNGTKCFCDSVTINDLPSTSIRCSHAGLSRIALNFAHDVDNLYELNYAFNDISDLDAPLDLPNLIVLDLSYNNIRTIGNDYFARLRRLETLDLSHNKLTAIESDWFRDAIDLKRLRLNHNAFARLPPNAFLPLRNLIDIDLSYNRVDGLEGRSFLTQTIGLNRNLSRLTLNNVLSSGAAFHGRAFLEFDRLATISLADNDLNAIPVLPKDIVELDLSGNNFTEVKTINFDYKKLRVLRLNRLRKLRTVHDYAFYHLTSLTELHLADCPKLQRFNELAFEYLENDVELTLKKLSLAGSGLQTLNHTYLHLFNTMDAIDLRNNPWKCSCENAWIQLIRKKKLNGPDSVICTSSKYAIGKPLMEFDFTYCANGSKGNGHRTARIIVPILVILIVLLMILIIYLCYLNPSKYGRRFPIGPTSPYSQMREEL